MRSRSRHRQSHRAPVRRAAPHRLNRVGRALPREARQGSAPHRSRRAIRRRRARTPELETVIRQGPRRRVARPPETERQAVSRTDRPRAALRPVAAPDRQAPRPVAAPARRAPRPVAQPPACKAMRRHPADRPPQVIRAPAPSGTRRLRATVTGRARRPVLARPAPRQARRPVRSAGPPLRVRRRGTTEST